LLVFANDCRSVSIIEIVNRLQSLDILDPIFDAIVT
jgi:hypothetical protein